MLCVIHRRFTLHGSVNWVSVIKSTSLAGILRKQGTCVRPTLGVCLFIIKWFIHTRHVFVLVTQTHTYTEKLLVTNAIGSNRPVHARSCRSVTRITENFPRWNLTCQMTSGLGARRGSLLLLRLTS